MKTFRRILSLCVAVVTLSSCFTTLSLTGVVLSNIVPGEKVTLSGHTCGQIADSNQCALLKTDGGETVCIVYEFGTYHDGKRIKDRFVRAGLYRYISDGGAELYAPIFIRKKDYKRLWPLAAELDVNSQAGSGKGEVFI